MAQSECASQGKSVGMARGAVIQSYVLYSDTPCQIHLLKKRQSDGLQVRLEARTSMLPDFLRASSELPQLSSGRNIADVSPKAPTGSGCRLSHGWDRYDIWHVNVDF